LVAAFDTKSIQHWQKLLTETLHVLKLGVDACDMSTQHTARRSGKRNTTSTAHGPALGLQKENLFQHASGVIKKTMVIYCKEKECKYLLTHKVMHGSSGRLSDHHNWCSTCNFS
jgi:hypothetical protein